jgi:hypothetical protein
VSGHGVDDGSGRPSAPVGGRLTLLGAGAVSGAAGIRRVRAARA